MGLVRYALIMAAGRGLRMMPLTAKIPKAMAPYAGSTLIAYGIDLVSQHVPRVYVTVGYRGALLAEHVISHGVTGLFDTSGKDNAWWLFNTLMTHLDEPVFVLTCDNVTKLDFSALEREYEQLGSPAAMLVPVSPVRGLDGDYIHREHHVVKKVSRMDQSDIYCSGIQILNPRKVASLIEPCDNFYDVWDRLIIKGQLFCASIQPERWFVADTISQLKSLPRGIESRST